METRIAKTINDVAEMFNYMQVELQQVEGNAIYIQFPVLPDETPRTPDPLYDYQHYSKNDPHRFTQQCRQTIRCLVGPRFRRLTSTIDQIHCFFKFHNGKAEFPNTKVIKKANQPLTIQFADKKNCDSFYKAIKKSGLFKSARV